MTTPGSFSENLARIKRDGDAQMAKHRANLATQPVVSPTAPANPILLAGHVYELRAPKTRQGTVSGYYDTASALYRDAETLDGKVPGLYFTVNPVNAALHARAYNRFVTHAKSTTSDADIPERHYFLIDCDAVRPADISSTHAEHQAAVARAVEIRAWLTSLAWPEPVMADSGNGAHLLYKILLPNDHASRDLVKAVLEVLALKFNDQSVTIDTSVSNAARITKLYGTMVCKGDSTEDRPHRRSQILHIPDELIPVPHPRLAQLAQRRPADPKPSYPPMNGTRFDLRDFIQRHRLLIAREKSWNGGTVFELESCPFNAEHQRDSSIIEFPSGALAFQCFHNSCQAHHWQDLRTLLEPDRSTRTRPMARPPDEASAPSELDGPVLVTLANVTPENVTWLWRDRIARGKVNLVIGPPGVGKSYETLDVAARHSRGMPWPDGQACSSGATILLGAEDGLADTIRPRLDVLGADVTRIHALTMIRERGTERGFDLSRDLEALRRMVQRTKATLVVIDPLSAYLGKIESYKDAEVRSVLAPLAALAEQEGVAIICIMHLNKSTTASVMNRAAGSIAFVAAARTVLGIGLDPNDETRHLLMSIKSNVGVLPPTLAFRIGPNGLTWEEAPATDVSADAVFGAPSPESADEKAGHQDARAFLRDLLADGGVPADKVFAEGRKVGLSPSQIRRASHVCHVVTRKLGFSTGWTWSLPVHDDDEEVLHVD